MTKNGDERKGGPNLLLLGSLGIAVTAALWVIIWPKRKRHPRCPVARQSEEDWR